MFHPQVTALDALRAASTSPASVHFQHGFPFVVRLELAAREVVRFFVDAHTATILTKHALLSTSSSQAD